MLQADFLVDAYDRMSDIQGNPFASNIGDVRASLESTKKATAIRGGLGEDLIRNHPRASSTPSELAATRRRLSGNREIEWSPPSVYRQAVTAGDVSFTCNPEDLETRKVVARATQRLCAISMALGDTKGALGSCQRSVALYDGLLASASADMGLREDAAGASVAYANALRLTGNAREAQAVNGKAIAALERLSTEEPTNGQARLELATALARQGTIQSGLSEDGAALESDRRAVDGFDGLLVADPVNQRIPDIAQLPAASPFLDSSSRRRGGRSVCLHPTRSRPAQAQAERATAGPMT